MHIPLQPALVISFDPILAYGLGLSNVDLDWFWLSTDQDANPLSDDSEMNWVRLFWLNIGLAGSKTIFKLEAASGSQTHNSANKVSLSTTYRNALINSCTLSSQNTQYTLYSTVFSQLRPGTPLNSPCKLALSVLSWPLTLPIWARQSWLPRPYAWPSLTSPVRRKSAFLPMVLKLMCVCALTARA